MTEPQDRWPTSDAETVVVNHDPDTLVGAPAPPPPPPAAGPPPADRRIGAGMLLGLGAILLVAAGIAIAWFLTHRDNKKQVTTVVQTAPAKRPTIAKVAVPRVIGLKEQQALVRLAQVGLRPKEIYKPTRQPKGVVVSQKPQEAADVKQGTQVAIVIDSGAPKVALPNLVGKSASDAQAALDKLGLDSTRTQVTSSQPAGTIVDMAPKPGAKLAKGSVVTLSVAKQAAQQQTTTASATTTPATTTAPTTTAAAPPQPTTAKVPDVSGQNEASAVQSFAQAGILASIAFVPSQDPLGTVEAQAKAAGATVPYHSHVQINVSAGQSSTTTSVPSVVGQTLQQAVSTLNAHHLRLIYVKYAVTSQSQAGKVVQQSPLSGSAPQNAQVLVYLGALQKQ
ncbi:MAG TPA: PASTA domain-containing protein [Gaiellaceae bacterium]